MKDLKSQLASRFGVAEPAEPEPQAPAQPTVDPLLGDDAHQGTQWLQHLRHHARTFPGAPKLAARPSLGQARQVTDQLAKPLKKAGRKREAGELVSTRDTFLARRDRAAWSAVKGRFAERGLSQKAYRALKQEGSDPLAVLGRLDALTDEALAGMGAARLREALGQG